MHLVICGMELTSHLAKHLRDVHFGGNWTWSNMKDNLADVTWKEAVTKVHSFNTIATLTFHIHYFVVAIKNVLEGTPLTANDKFSFDHPPITSEADWQKMLEVVWKDAETVCSLIEKLPESKLWETFVHEKYGSYYRNIAGLTEHTHYHLWQIALIKKIIREKQE